MGRRVRRKPLRPGVVVATAHPAKSMTLPFLVFFFFFFVESWSPSSANRVVAWFRQPESVMNLPQHAVICSQPRRGSGRGPARMDPELEQTRNGLR